MFPLIPAVSAFMSTITTAISSIGTFISTYGPTIIKAIDTVKQVFEAVAKAFNVLSPNDEIGDLGGRALQASEEGVQPEQFATYDEYLDHLRAMDYQPELSKYSDTEKNLTGIAITSRGFEEKLNLPASTMGIVGCMIAFAPNYFTDQRINTWIKNDYLNQAVRYFGNELGASDSFKTEQKLIGIEKQTREESDFVLEQELEQVKTDLYHKGQELE